MSEEAAEPKICEPGGKGLLLPLLSQENEWGKGGRAVMYMMLLLWCFLGVSIVADIFMAAIEAVTSVRTSKKLSNGRTVSVKWWNPTVANLTLMALGSSAPEILLSIIELLGNDFYSGELGPGTIVGSAAFNLLVIIAVCVQVIPEGQKRTIKQPVVFLITAVFSVFAYLWLIFILAIVTPDVVEPWEGCLTFYFFIILVVVAYLADIGVIGKRSSSEEEAQLDALRDNLMEDGQTWSKGDLALMRAVAEQHETKSRSERRLQVSNGTAAKKAKNFVQNQDLSVGFLSQVFYFKEDEKAVSLDIEKTGALAGETEVKLKVATYDNLGNAIDMKELSIPVGQVRASVAAPVPEAWKEDSKKYFYVDIISAVVDGSKDKKRDSDAWTTEVVAATKTSPVKRGHRVNIHDGRYRAKAFMKAAHEIESGLGQVRMHMPELSHSPSSQEHTVCKVKVERFGGSEGELQCKYRTEAASARHGRDFMHSTGILTFQHGAVMETIEVPITMRNTWEGKDSFIVLIGNVDDEKPLVVEDASTCTVTIAEVVDGKGSAKMMRTLDQALNFDSLVEGNVKWMEQFKWALRPVGDEDGDGEMDEATASDWAIHFVALPWKVFFAAIPPPSYCGGKLCFGIALVFIGCVTAIIGDLASLMGCCMGLPDAITAITFVALGTSLPDTFASKVAAVEDSTADNAIGNVTGSNSVNVFLGLGLPWMIASIYWVVAPESTLKEWKLKYPDIAPKYPDGGFIVVAGDLVFSVIVFTTVSLLALGTIGYRRKAFEAELGGPSGPKSVTTIFFVLLWIMYVACASWKILNSDASVGVQVAVLVIGLAGVLVMMIILSLLLSGLNYWRRSRDQMIKDDVSYVLQEQAKQVSNQAAQAVILATNGGQPIELSKVVADLRRRINDMFALCNNLEATIKTSKAKPVTRAQTLLQTRETTATMATVMTPSREAATSPLLGGSAEENNLRSRGSLLEDDAASDGGKAEPTEVVDAGDAAAVKKKKRKSHRDPTKEPKEKKGAKKAGTKDLSRAESALDTSA